jgi:bacillithiol system protein YtxJ
MILPLGTAADLDAALAAPVAVLYKHSPRCGVCIAAEREVRHFAEGHPAVPVYWLDVVAERGLAQLAAARLNVRHESPQVILVEGGAVRLAASHWDVRAADLDARVRTSGPAGTPALRGPR